MCFLPFVVGVVTPYDLLVIPLDIHKNVVRRGDAIVKHIALSNDDLDIVLTFGDIDWSGECNMDILLALLADRTQHRLSEHWHLKSPIQSIRMSRISMGMDFREPQATSTGIERRVAVGDGLTRRGVAPVRLSHDSTHIP
jgi:hypothetical protein